jgi:hypothetical protein
MAKPTRSMSDILDAIGMSLHDCQNVLKRYAEELATTFEPTIQGRSREFSRENAYELAFIAAITSAGVKLSEALPHAAALLRARRGGWRRWMYFLAGDGTTGGKSHAPPSEAAMKQLLKSDRPPVYTCIDLDEIVRRVDAVFDLGGETS